MKAKMKVVVGQATHFLRWELPFLREHFHLVSEPADDVVLLVFGPDVLESSSALPAIRRVAMLFPGFGFNPYHNLECRQHTLDVVESCYDLVFASQGPVSEALKSSRKVALCTFSVDTRSIGKYMRLRRRIDSLLHVSADFPQKDWTRSAQIMEFTGLRWEIFPPRRSQCEPKAERMKRKVNAVSRLLGCPDFFRLMPQGYVSHRTVAKKYQQFDGFVHVAAEYPSPIYLDGKYTASLLEAGLTGAILFWHDTFGLGNDFETIFDVALDPWAAAQMILEIRACLDVERHSRRTREEILDRCSPDRVVAQKAARIYNLL